MRWALLFLLVAGCTSTAGDAIAPLQCWDRNVDGACDPATEDLTGPDGMPDGQCDTYDCSAGACSGEYPTEPKGTSEGQVIENYGFQGFARPAEERTVAKICLDAFFNPSGDATYEASAPFPEGEPKPQLLLINVAALWCQPCKEEAATTLPEIDASLGPQGLEILTVLTDSEVAGAPASLVHVGIWADTFPNEFPVVNDPEYQLGALVDTTSYPSNFVIDTSDMRIVRKITGKPDAGFEDQLAALLAAP
jgi:hypothetical protein